VGSSHGFIIWDSIVGFFFWTLFVCIKITCWPKKFTYQDDPAHDSVRDQDRDLAGESIRDQFRDRAGDPFVIWRWSCSWTYWWSVRNKFVILFTNLITDRSPADRIQLVIRDPVHEQVMTWSPLRDQHPKMDNLVTSEYWLKTYSVGRWWRIWISGWTKLQMLRKGGCLSSGPFISRKQLRPRDTQGTATTRIPCRTTPHIPFRSWAHLEQHDPADWGRKLRKQEQRNIDLP
jgi:hypothetical protein